MEKQTKILLGLGAVIAAYLILKPKKTAAQTNVVSQNTKDPYICPSGYKLTPKPMGLTSMEVCEDANGNKAEKQSNPFYSKDTVDMGASNNIGNNLYEYNGKTYTITRKRLDYNYGNGNPAFGWNCVDQNGNECDLKNFPF